MFYNNYGEYKMKDNDFHFFASSAMEWRTNKDIRKLIKTMDSFKQPYALFYIPLPDDAEYKINNYVPQVKDKVYLGSSDESKISYTNAII